MVTRAAYTITALSALAMAARALPLPAAEELLVPLKPTFRVSEGRGGPLKGMRYTYFDPRRREVYVCAAGSHRVAIFDEQGLPLNDMHIRVRDPRTGDTVDGEPTCVATDSRGRMYLLDDIAPGVQVRSYRGDLERMVDLDEVVGTGPNTILPVALAIDEEDSIYIANAATPEIMVFDPDWTLRERFGAAGDGPGLFRGIASIFVPQPGVVYVVQSKGVPVQVFTPETRPSLAFGRHDYGKENFSLPTSILAAPTGEILVVDRMRHFVKVFDEQGKFVYQFGGLGASLGRFRYPMCIAGDGERVLYVVDGNGLTGFEVVAPIGKLITPGELRAGKEGCRGQLQDATAAALASGGALPSPPYAAKRGGETACDLPVS